jgi:hypothetical protein
MKFCKPAILRFKLRLPEGSRGQQSKPTDRKENWQDHQDSPSTYDNHVIIHAIEQC